MRSRAGNLAALAGGARVRGDALTDGIIDADLIIASLMPLRILHVAPYSPDAWAYGGIPRVVGALTEGLASRGHDVVLCATDALDPTRRLPPGACGRAVEWRILPNVSNGCAYHLQAFAPIGLRRLLRREVPRFDVVHLHACHNVLTAFASRACIEAGVPYVISPNGTAPILERRRLLKRAFRVVTRDGSLTGARRVLAVTHAETFQLRELGISRDRIDVLPNPIDLSECPPPNTAPGHERGTAPQMLFVGKITPRKQLVTVVEAVARLQQPATRLVIAGSDQGGLKPALARARALGISEQVQFVGLLEGPDRLSAMASADLVVYPSRDEVFGLVACEALLMGTPVIVGADSGAAEVVSATGGGLTVQPGDAAALAAAMGRILGAADSWRADAVVAAGRVRALYDSRRIVASLEAIYLRCMTAGRRIA